VHLAYELNEINELRALTACRPGQTPDHFLSALPIHAEAYQRALRVDHCPVANDTLDTLVMDYQ